MRFEHLVSGTQNSCFQLSFPLQQVRISTFSLPLYGPKSKISYKIHQFSSRILRENNFKSTYFVLWYQQTLNLYCFEFLPSTFGVRWRCLDIYVRKMSWSHKTKLTTNIGVKLRTTGIPLPRMLGRCGHCFTSNNKVPSYLKTGGGASDCSPTTWSHLYRVPFCDVINDVPSKAWPSI